MSVLNIQEQLTGGESVYCINVAQMQRTRGMLDGDDASSERIREFLGVLEEQLDRNERAALAFALIERLNGTGEA